MVRDSRDKDFPVKQEAGDLDNGINPRRFCFLKAWSGLKDPRIVRISRSFGGKDRHSKVSTIRGLRDRRVRLSVPTAIQLYDLQDRLGLSQPSKVVDWLLKATEHEIDKLPPLQMPQENFIHHPQSTTSSHALNLSQARSTTILDKNLDCFKDHGSHSLSLFSNKINDREEVVIVEEEQIGLDKFKGVNREMGIEKSNWNMMLGQENQEGMQVHNGLVLAHNPFSLPNHSLLSNLANNALPYNPCYHWEPSNASTSHMGGQGYTSQIADIQSSNASSISSSLSLFPGSQLRLSPTIPSSSTMVPYIRMPFDYDCKQVSHSQAQGMNSQNPLTNSLITSLYSICSPMRPFPVGMNLGQQHFQNNLECQTKPLNKGNSLSSSSFPNDSKLVLTSNEENLG